MDLNDPRIPIIGQPRAEEQPNAPGLTINCEVYDSEIDEIQRTLEILNEKASQGRVSYEAFDREIRERFQDLGFIVSIAWWDAMTPDGARIPGLLLPEITLKDRAEKKEFDHDRQVHEVTHDVLELGEGGVIKSNPADFQNGGHSHG